MARPATEELRRRNRSALLDQLHRRGPQTRAELTEALGLNRSTIGALAADLSQSGHIRETIGRSTGSAGRPSTLVECVAEAATIAAVTGAGRSRPSRAVNRSASSATARGTAVSAGSRRRPAARASRTTTTRARPTREAGAMVTSGAK